MMDAVSWTKKTALAASIGAPIGLVSLASPAMATDFQSFLTGYADSEYGDDVFGGASGLNAEEPVGPNQADDVVQAQTTGEANWDQAVAYEPDHRAAAWMPERRPEMVEGLQARVEIGLDEPIQVEDWNDTSSEVVNFRGDGTVTNRSISAVSYDDGVTRLVQRSWREDGSIAHATALENDELADELNVYRATPHGISIHSQKSYDGLLGGLGSFFDVPKKVVASKGDGAPEIALFDNTEDSAPREVFALTDEALILTTIDGGRHSTPLRQDWFGTRGKREMPSFWHNIVGAIHPDGSKTLTFRRMTSYEGMIQIRSGPDGDTIVQRINGRDVVVSSDAIEIEGLETMTPQAINDLQFEWTAGRADEVMKSYPEKPYRPRSRQLSRSGGVRE